MTICGHEKKGAKENSSGTADGLTTNSVTVAEHMNLNTVLFSPPVDGALYPLLPTCRDCPTHSAMKSGDKFKYFNIRDSTLNQNPCASHLPINAMTLWRCTSGFRLCAVATAVAAQAALASHLIGRSAMTIFSSTASPGQRWKRFLPGAVSVQSPVLSMSTAAALIRNQWLSCQPPPERRRRENLTPGR